MVDGEVVHVRLSVRRTALFDGCQIRGTQGMVPYVSYLHYVYEYVHTNSCIRRIVVFVSYRTS